MPPLLDMGIFNIDLDLELKEQPRNEPKFTIPRRSAGRRKSENPTQTISSPRVILDAELSIRSGISQHQDSRVVRNDFAEGFEDVSVDQREQIVIIAKDKVEGVGEVIQTVSRLSKPIWPKSTPTIPSTIYKNDFKLKVFK